MKIIFVVFGSYTYVSEFGYQENDLARTARKHGDEVVVISTTYVPPLLKEYVDVTPEFVQEDRVDQFGVRVVRVKYRFPFLGESINLRLREYKGIYHFLQQENPDLIFVHDIQAWSVFEIARYLKNHPECRSAIALHATYKNGCRTFISKYVQHRLFYRFIVRRTISAFDTVYYLTRDALHFFETEYGVTIEENKRAFLPIGGIVYGPEERKVSRKSILTELGFSEETIMILHTGKLEESKKTVDLLNALWQSDDEKYRLIIIGKIPDATKASILPAIERDNRVCFLGWKSADEMRRYMLACDLYAQPGSESASLNNAICCGCPVMLSPEDQVYGGYRTYLAEDKVFFVNTVADMVQVFNTISSDPKILERYSKYSYQYANDLLDYEVQIERIKGKTS